MAEMAQQESLSLAAINHMCGPDCVNVEASVANDVQTGLETAGAAGVPTRQLAGPGLEAVHRSLAADDSSPRDCHRFAEKNGPIEIQSTSIVFVFAGEGAHSADTDISNLKTSPAWSQIDAALRIEIHKPGLEHFLCAGTHCSSFL